MNMSEAFFQLFLHTLQRAGLYNQQFRYKSQESDCVISKSRDGSGDGASD